MNKNTYASKFCEGDVQAIVERNRAINDQENEDMQLDTEEELSVEDSFSKQSPADFGLECKSINTNKNGISLIMQNQPTEVSDDGLRELIRPLQMSNGKRLIWYFVGVEIA